MKNDILSINDSNIAGDVWNWTWRLEEFRNGTFMLICEQSGDCLEPLEINPRKHLKDGFDVYISLEEMMSEAGYSIHDFDLLDIAEKVSKISGKIAIDFRNAPEIFEEREENVAVQQQEIRKRALAPFRSVIDNYVATLSDKEKRGAGTFYGTQRFWVNRFIEDFVIANGSFPKGKHPLVVRIGGAGYSGGEHDFDKMHGDIHQKSGS